MAPTVVSISPEYLQQAQRIAQDSGASVSEIVHKALAQFFARKNNSPCAKLAEGLLRMSDQFDTPELRKATADFVSVEDDLYDMHVRGYSARVK